MHLLRSEALEYQIRTRTFGPYPLPPKEQILCPVTLHTAPSEMNRGEIRGRVTCREPNPLLPFDLGPRHVLGSEPTHLILNLICNHPFGQKILTEYEMIVSCFSTALAVPRLDLVPSSRSRAPYRVSNEPRLVLSASGFSLYHRLGSWLSSIATFIHRDDVIRNVVQERPRCERMGRGGPLCSLSYKTFATLSPHTRAFAFHSALRPPRAD